MHHLLVDYSCQLGQLLLPERDLLGGSTGVTPLQDGLLKLPLELRGGAENASVDKVQETEVLQQVILYGRARQKDTSRSMELSKGSVG